MNRTQLSRRFFTFFDVIPFTFTAFVFIVASVFAYSYLVDNYNIGEPSSQAVFAAVAEYLLLFFLLLMISNEICKYFLFRRMRTTKII